MDKSLILEGKKYISARRVSEKSGYNSDYLGQLCRGGKLDCKLVSRAWFVEESSLIEHLKKGRKKTSPLLTEMNIKSEVTVSPAEAQQEKTTLENLEEKSISEVFILRKLFNNKILAGLLITVFISFSAAVYLSNPFVKDSSLSVMKGLNGFVQRIAAGISPESPASISELIGNLKKRIASWFFSGKKLTVDERFLKEETETDSIENERKGLVSIPWSEFEQQASSEVVKEYVKESFSDEVLVFPDESKTSGLIKPVFREGNKEEYLYVMVPVEDKN